MEKSVSVLIPYRYIDDRRESILEWVYNRYRFLAPNYEICIGENDSDLFNRAAARNDAFRKSSGDILIIADADTIPDIYSLKTAVEIVSCTQTWVLPYGKTGYYNLTKDYSDWILRQPPTIGYPIPGQESYWEHKIESWAGILVMEREGFDTVGGYDESFIGWGYEDNAFMLAMNTLWSPLTRLSESNILHLWHEAPEENRFESPNISYNRNRYQKYLHALHNEELMRQLKGRDI